MQSFQEKAFEKKSYVCIIFDILDRICNVKKLLNEN